MTSTSCCNQCPCAKAKAISLKGYSMTVDATVVSSLLQALSSAVDPNGNLLKINSISTNTEFSVGQIAAASTTTAGSVMITITLDEYKESQEDFLNAVNTIMNLSAVFGACTQAVDGVLIQSNAGTQLQAMAAVVSQAVSAGIFLSTMNTLFCSSPPVPVQFWVATKQAEALTTIINAGMYLCNGDPIN